MAAYTGPVCFVPARGLKVRRRFLLPGRRELAGGWHYSTRIVRGQEVPHRRLHLNTEGALPFYEFARRGHRSWDQQNPGASVVQMPGLPPGEAHPPEAYAAHPRHEHWRHDQGQQQ